MGKALNDSVVLVSGGTRGLGLAIGKRLIDTGARVVAFSRRPTAEAEKVAAENPDSFFLRTADNADPDSLKAVVRFASKELAPVFGLVNNAALIDETLLAFQDEDTIENMFDVNVLGTMRLTRLAMRDMMIKGEGRIVNISSIVGGRGFKGVAAYSATKGAIEAMTRSLARELGTRGITVNAVAPGYMETDMTKAMNQKQLEQIVRRTPLKRPGTVEDVAGVVSFLFSPDAQFVNGQTIVVDGGLTC